MFMQAGFAFLEAGLTRMKNAAHIAGKNVLIFGVCSLVYWAVGFGIAFSKGNAVFGTDGFFPSVDSLLEVGKAPFEFFTTIPGAAGYLFEVVFAGVSLAIVWGAMAERAKLWVYFAFGVAFTVIYSVTSHWIWGGGWLFGLGMQDFAGSTVVHYQGALAALAGAILLGPRIGKFAGGRGNPIPGHNIPYAVLGTIILWFGWFGFNPGSTLAVDHRRQARLLRLRRADDQPRRRSRRLQRRADRPARPQEGGHLDDAERRPRRAGRRHGRIGLRRAVGSGRDRPRLRRDRGARRALGRADRDRRPDRRGRRAWDVRGLGDARHGAVRGSGSCRHAQDRNRRPRLHRLLPPDLGPAARPARGRHLHLLGVLRLPLGDEQAVGNPGRAARSRRPGWTSPSTACGAIPSSTSRSPAATERSRTATSSPTSTSSRRAEDEEEIAEAA